MSHSSRHFLDSLDADIHDRRVYRVTYLDHGRYQVSSGHTKYSASLAFSRLTAKAGIRDVQILATGESFSKKL